MQLPLFPGPFPLVPLTPSLGSVDIFLLGCFFSLLLVSKFTPQVSECIGNLPLQTQVCVLTAQGSLFSLAVLLDLGLSRLCLFTEYEEGGSRVGLPVAPRLARLEGRSECTALQEKDALTQSLKGLVG